MAGGEKLYGVTPSWVVGVVVFLMVAVSLVVEKLLSFLGRRLKQADKKPLYEALQKIKEELMLLGFISLFLAVFQNNITSWCIPEKLSIKGMPCKKESSTKTTSHFLVPNGGRLLAEAAATSCPKGKAPFVTIGVIHDLHYLIFILAIVHAVSCTVTILLGEAKIRQWWKWEDSIRKMNESNTDGDRVIDVRSLTFIKDRFEGVDAQKRHYVISFFKHLAGIVTKADYEAMRMGFILTHCNNNQKFNFHRYMVYAYEADFKKVVSISWYFWLFVVISLTLNIAGWNIYFWISFIPLILLLIVGTKLEQVITDLAIFIAQRHSVFVGDVKVEPSDEYFWFHKPKFFLILIHIMLFINSFGFAVFFWTLFTFKFNSCVMGDAKYVIARLIIMVVVQTICSYSTLPLYAIVTQMGSSYNKEAMVRHDTESSDRITENRIPEIPNTEASVEMANQQGGQRVV